MPPEARAGAFGFLQGMLWQARSRRQTRRALGRLRRDGGRTGLAADRQGTPGHRRTDGVELPPFIGNYKPMSDRPHCSAINQFAFDYIRTSSPDIVIISFSPSYDTDLPSQAANTVRQLRRFFAGPLLVVGPPPLWSKAFPETLLSSYLATRSPDALRFLAMPPDVAHASEKVDETVGKAVLAEGATYVSAAQQLCHERRCVAMPEGEPAVWDRFHMTKGASSLWRGRSMRQSEASV